MVAGHSVARTLVDIGSSVDIIFQEMLHKMNIRNYLVKSNYRPLTGFDGDTTMFRSSIKLLVKIGGECRNVKFLIVDKPAIYNIIIDTPWIHQMRAVPSMYHQCLKFPTPTGPFIIEHQL